MDFDIAPQSSTPIYRQIVDQIRRMVASGQLKPGESLPSVRTVAMQHTINPMTVSKAYSLLENEGLLVRLRGVGMAVAQGESVVAERDKIAMLLPELDNVARMARQLAIDPETALRLFKQCLERTPEPGSEPPPSEHHTDE